MPSILYTRNAAAAPAFMTPASLLDPYQAGALPIGFESFGTGDTSAATAKLIRNAIRATNASRYGSGAYGVQVGVGFLTPGGLTLGLSAGFINCDSPVYISARTQALPDNVNGASWINIWISANGSITVKTDNTQPSSASVYLGGVQTTAGAITALDYSNRVEFRGGVPYRRSADAGAPADTPPSGSGFVHQTAGGIFFWVGVSYVGTLDSNLLLTDGSDAAPGTLALKTKAGTGITLSVVVDGGVRKLKIDAAAVPTAGIQLLAADPGSPADGDIWYNTATHLLKTRVNGVTRVVNDWASLTSVPSTFAPSAHAASHLPNAADALDWTGTIHRKGTLASRPAAAAGNAGTLYLATDDNGGTTYRSDGAAWLQIAGAVSPPAVASTSAADGANAGLQVFYGFNDDLTEATGTGLAMTGHGSLSYVDSPGGRALHLDGASHEYLSHTFDARYAAPTDGKLLICARVRLTATGGIMYFAAVQDGSIPVRHWRLGYNGTTFQFEVTPDNINATVVTAADITPSSGIWYDVEAWPEPGVAIHLRASPHGGAVGADNSTAYVSALSAPGACPFTIGGDYLNAPTLYSWDGDIDYVALFDRGALPALQAVVRTSQEYPYGSLPLGLVSPLTADLDAGGFEVKNAHDPTTAQSLVTRAYLLAQIPAATKHLIYSAYGNTGAVTGTPTTLTRATTSATINLGVVVRQAMTVTDLDLRPTANLGSHSSATYIVTLYKNGSATALTGTLIADGSGTGANVSVHATGSISVAAGDLLELRASGTDTTDTLDVIADLWASF